MVYEAKDTKVRRRVLGNKDDEKESQSKSSQEGFFKTRDVGFLKTKLEVNTLGEGDLEKTEFSAVHWWTVLALVTGLAIVTRLHKIEVPAQIW